MYWTFLQLSYLAKDIGSPGRVMVISFVSFISSRKLKWLFIALSPLMFSTVLRDRMNCKQTSCPVIQTQWSFISNHRLGLSGFMSINLASTPIWFFKSWTLLVLILEHLVFSPHFPVRRNKGIDFFFSLPSKVFLILPNSTLEDPKSSLYCYFTK